MRKILLSLLLIIGSLGIAQAQKYAYVDSEYILKKIPEYAQAQRQLDLLSKQWEGEIQSMYSEVDALTQAYNAEKILLSPEMQKEREQTISTKKLEARKLQMQYFGPEGDLFKKRMELVKPIQDQIFNAVKEVATKKKLDIVFDKSGDIIMLYTSPKSDISDDVLEKMGYRN